MGTPRRRFDIGLGTQRSIRFLVALGLLIYEAVIYQGEVRWHLLLLYGTMMGLPLAELGDEVRRHTTRSEEEVDDEPDPRPRG